MKDWSQNLDRINTKQIWNEHYTKSKSKLIYPDENLVRILSKINLSGKALDFGAGSGRHSILLKSYGFDVTAVDYTENSIAQIHEIDKTIKTFVVSNLPYPFLDNEFSLIVSWGVLHYNSLDIAKKMISEYKRCLSPNGVLVGTVRSSKDTFLKASQNTIGADDLKGANIYLYDLDTVQELLENFRDIQIGYMERSPIGKLEDRICHWIFQAHN